MGGGGAVEAKRPGTEWARIERKAPDEMKKGRGEGENRERKKMNGKGANVHRKK